MIFRTTESREVRITRLDSADAPPSVIRIRSSRNIPAAYSSTAKTHSIAAATPALALTAR